MLTSLFKVIVPISAVLGATIGGVRAETGQGVTGVVYGGLVGAVSGVAIRGLIIVGMAVDDFVRKKE